MALPMHQKAGTYLQGNQRFDNTVHEEVGRKIDEEEMG